MFEELAHSLSARLVARMVWVRSFEHLRRWLLCSTYACVDFLFVHPSHLKHFGSDSEIMRAASAK